MAVVDVVWSQRMRRCSAGQRLMQSQAQISPAATIFILQSSHFIMDTKMEFHNMQLLPEN